MRYLLGRLTPPFLLGAHLISGIAIVAMLLITVADVLSRALFNKPIGGVVEIVELCVIWTTMLGIAIAWAEKSQIVVDVSDVFAAPRVIGLFDLFAQIVSAVVMALLAWLAFGEFRDIAAFGDRTADLSLPLTWFWSAIVAGYSLSVLFLVISPRWQQRDHG